MCFHDSKGEVPLILCKVSFVSSIVSRSAVNKALKMGASNGKSLKCPLCYEECREQVTLRCNHSFCRACIRELWSGSQTGPYYCPECRYEYQNLPDYTDGASTSTATPNTRTFMNRGLNKCWLFWPWTCVFYYCIANV